MTDTPDGGVPRARRTTGMGTRALRNTALALSARVLSRAIALVTFAITARHLQPARYGDFQLVVNVSALVTVVLDLGFNTLFQREAARRPAELGRYLSNLVSARILFALPALAIFAGWLSVQGVGAYLVPGFVMMLLASYSGLLRGALYAVQRLGFEAAEVVLESVVLLGLVVYGVVGGQGIAYFLWAYAASYAFAGAYFVSVLTLRRIASIGWRLEPRLVRAWLWRGLPFALAFVITTIYFKVDVPILHGYRGAYETGLYSAAYKLFEALLFIPLAMLNVVFPVLAVYHREAPGRVAPTVARFFKGLLVLGWPITVGTFLLAPAFLPIYQFPQAEPALRILALGVVFMFVSNAFAGALNAIDRQLLFTWAALGSMVVNLALNFSLIPFFGFLGASWATVLTEVALTLFAGLLAVRELGPLRLLGPGWRVIVAGLVMGAALYPWRAVHGPQALAAIAGAAVLYAGVLLLIGGVDAEERRLVWGALRR